MTICQVTGMACRCQPDDGVPCTGLADLQQGFHGWRDEALAIGAKYRSAVRTLQDIAAMGKKAGSEAARHRLIMLGEPDDSGRQPVSASE